MPANPPSPSFRAGDAVHHRPSGESWLLAAVDRAEVLPAGWPPTRAAARDCELLEAASDEAHADMVRRCRAMDGPDERRSLAIEHWCGVCTKGEVVRG
jgi:hypothetical protein